MSPQNGAIRSHAPGGRRVPDVVVLLLVHADQDGVSAADEHLTGCGRGRARKRRSVRHQVSAGAVRIRLQRGRERARAGGVRRQREPS